MRSARALAHPVRRKPDGVGHRGRVVADGDRRGRAVVAVDHVVADEAVDPLDLLDELLLDLADECVDVTDAVAGVRMRAFSLASSRGVLR